mgnify:CR=1 FL=1
MKMRGLRDDDDDDDNDGVQSLKVPSPSQPSNLPLERATPSFLFFVFFLFLFFNALRGESDVRVFD